MTNEQICQAILAVEQSDFKSLFDGLNNQNKEIYKLCFNLKSLQLYFCESPNSESNSDEDILLCEMNKAEILDNDVKQIIIDKIQDKFGVCNEDEI